jgi:hypothetical protein
MIRQKMISKTRVSTPRTKPSKSVTKRKATVNVPKPAEPRDEAKDASVVGVTPFEDAGADV